MNPPDTYTLPRRTFILVGAVALALIAIISFSIGKASADGVHHPCSGPSLLWKDYSHQQNTPADGVVWLKVGNKHYNVGWHPAGWDVPAQFDTDPSEEEVKMQDTSHHDGCGEGTPPTTTVVIDTTAPPTTTLPPTTIPQTDPPTTTNAPTTVPVPTTIIVPTTVITTSTATPTTVVVTDPPTTAVDTTPAPTEAPTTSTQFVAVVGPPPVPPSAETAPIPGELPQTGAKKTLSIIALVVLLVGVALMVMSWRRRRPAVPVNYGTEFEE